MEGVDAVRAFWILIGSVLDRSNSKWQLTQSETTCWPHPFAVAVVAVFGAGAGAL